MAESGITVVPQGVQGKALMRQSNEIERLETRLKGLRGSVEKQGRKIQTAAVAVGAAFVFGNFKRNAAARNQTLPTVGTMDPELVWGAALYFGGPMIGGTGGEVAEAAGLGILCAFASNKGSLPSREPEALPEPVPSP